MPPTDPAARLPPGSIPPHATSATAAAIDRLTRYKHAVAWYEKSIANPASSGAANMVIEPMRLALLKLRAYSCGWLRIPTRFGSSTLYKVNAMPIRVDATNSAGSSRTKYGISRAPPPQTAAARSSQREPTRSAYRPTGHDISNGNA